MTTLKIYDLTHIPSDALRDVGGKAKGLFELSRCGLPIAKGFVAVNIGSDIALQAIADHYALSGLAAVAVRSSATAEDGIDFSSAGQYATVLNVQGKSAVKDAVITCIQSLGDDNAKSYAGYFSAAESDKMSVVVQEMIAADISGVCFTQHGEDTNTVHIEAVAGLGENLVSGKAAANTYHVPKQTMQTKGDDLLNSKLIAEIAKGACLASEKLGIPLDTEWAVSNGRLIWLQARPITVTEEVDAFELDSTCIGENDVLTTCNIGEMMPGAVTPLTMSTSMFAIDHGVRRMIKEAGASKHIDDYPPESCFPHVGGTMFINLNTMQVIADYVAGTDDKNIEIVLCGRVLEDTPERKKVSVSTLKRVINATKYFRILLSKKKACRKIAKLADNFEMPQHQSALAQFEAIDANMYKNNDAFWYHYISSGHSGSMSAALFFILTDNGITPDEANAAIAGVLEDIDGVESVDILRSLKCIAAQMIKENPDAAQLTAAEMAEYLRLSEDDSAYMLEHFIGRHGHRAIREAEISSKSWHMDDISLCGYLKSIISADAIEQKKGRGQENIDKLLNRYKGGLKRAMKFIIVQARDGVVNREFTKSKCIKILDQFKMGYIWLADLMVSEKILPERNLVYFLKHDELGRLVRGETSLVKKAVARRRVFEQQKQLRFNEVNIGKPVPVEVDYSKLEGSKVLTGTSISRGKVTGKARMIASVDDANQLEPGEIMVTAFTDIGWSPYYNTAGALITEVGSMLSHGAVVAREYALPLVSNIPYATKLIKTGDIVCVDANKGEIAILG